MICHKCQNPIWGKKWIPGDTNTFYHPVCKKIEDNDKKDVKSMATYYTELYTTKTTNTTRKSKK